MRWHYKEIEKRKGVRYNDCRSVTNPPTKNRKVSLLGTGGNLIAGRTLEQFDEKIIRSTKILHIRVGFSFIVLPHPGSCTAGARYTRCKEVTL